MDRTFSRCLELGGAVESIDLGTASSTPPTFVETQCRPSIAASASAIPKDSVRGVFRNMSHSAILYRTLSWSAITPSIFTWLYR